MIGSAKCLLIEISINFNRVSVVRVGNQSNHNVINPKNEIQIHLEYLRHSLNSVFQNIMAHGSRLARRINGINLFWQNCSIFFGVEAILKLLWLFRLGYLFLENAHTIQFYKMATRYFGKPFWNYSENSLKISYKTFHENL